MSRIFQYVYSQEEHAPFLRSFLNSTSGHNQPLTKELLDASLVYRLRAVPLPPPQVSADAEMPMDMADMLPMPMPAPEETESLIVPVFRRDRFVLGDLYGEISPNGLALRIMAQNKLDPPPVQIARRFCVDLSICDAVEFLEYEWFSDGKVIVSMHTIDLDGDYGGHSIVLDCSEEQQVNEPSSVAACSPLKVVMRMHFTETMDCGLCKDSRATCPCDGPSESLVNLSPKHNDSWLNWATWMTAFCKTRQGMSTTTISFKAVTPVGEIPGCMSFRLDQACEMGEESGLRLLRRSYEQLRAKHALDTAIDEIDDNATAVEDKVLETVDFDAPSFSPARSITDSATPTNVSDGDDPARRFVTPVMQQKSAAYPASAAGDRRKWDGSVRSRGVGKKVYTCECGVEFTHRGHLNVHIMTKHQKLRPHACTECSASFAKRSDLRRHAKSLHNMKSLDDDEDPDAAVHNRPFSCNHCDRRYATRQGLRKHEIAKHATGT
jgi:Zinc finger, C2H2 type